MVASGTGHAVRAAVAIQRIALLGKTLQSLIDALLSWRASNSAEVQRARTQFNAEF